MSKLRYGQIALLECDYTKAVRQFRINPEPILFEYDSLSPAEKSYHDNQKKRLAKYWDEYVLDIRLGRLKP